MSGKHKQGNLRSRIVGEGVEAPDQLLANPLNWRTHPKEQVDALEGLLRDVGWVQRVIVNRTTGHIVDGHARVELALRRSEATVPVLYVELTEAEERLVLAALDPIGGPVLAQEWCFVRPGDTAEELWRRDLGPMGVRLLVSVVARMAAEGYVEGALQDNDLATFEPAMDPPRAFRPDLPMLPAPRRHPPPIDDDVADVIASMRIPARA